MSRRLALATPPLRSDAAHDAGTSSRADGPTAVIHTRSLTELTLSQIGELLAQIGGDASAGASPSAAGHAHAARTKPTPAKRKPDNDLRPDASKASRQSPHPPAAGQRPRAASERPPQDRHAVAGNGVKPASAASAKPASATSRPSKQPVTARPQSGTASAPLPSRAPPKKGSFAEILARGQRAQAFMGQVGKIQHKKVEKGAARTKEDAKAGAPTKAKGAAAYKGTSKPAQQGGANAGGVPKTDGRPRPRVGSGAPVAQAETAGKKVKKAALATTGYAGTARPRPSSAAKARDAPRGGALLNAPVVRHGSSKRSRLEDDYDEDMDDFIEYDDGGGGGGGGGGPRYDYASDASSDMEAGMDELDVEEKRAEHLARQEDMEEERLERSLKAAKEERKRKALDALRAGRRR